MSIVKLLNMHLVQSLMIINLNLCGSQEITDLLHNWGCGRRVVWWYRHYMIESHATWAWFAGKR